MAQFRKSIFDVGGGPGLAVPDPRVDEALAIQRSNREAQAQAFVQRSAAEANLRALLGDQQRRRDTFQLAGLEAQREADARRWQAENNLVQALVRGDLERAAQERAEQARARQGLAELGLQLHTADRADARAAADREAQLAIARLNAGVRQQGEERRDRAEAAAAWNRYAQDQGRAATAAAKQVDEDLEALLTTSEPWQRVKLATEKSGGRLTEEQLAAAKLTAGQALERLLGSGNSELMRRGIDELTPTLRAVDRGRDPVEPSWASRNLGRTGVLGAIPAALGQVEDWLGTLLGAPFGFDVGEANRQVRFQDLEGVQGSDVFANVLAEAERRQRAAKLEERTRELLELRSAMQGQAGLADPRAADHERALLDEIERLRRSLEPNPYMGPRGTRSR